jgi:hypothetical protein
VRIHSQDQECQIPTTEMAETHHAAKPSWRPLAQKLSSLIRDNLARSKKSSVTPDEKSFMSRLKRREKLLPQENTQEFKPLEVDLNLSESIRLSEGWLDEARQPPSARETSTTPIGDLFINKPVFHFPISRLSGQLDGSWQESVNNERWPLFTVETRSITSIRRSGDLKSGTDTQAAGSSILDRGRPVEPKRFMTDLFPKKTGPRHNIALQVSKSTFEIVATPSDLSLNATKYSSGCSRSVEMNQNMFSQDWPAKTLNPNSRHSMNAAVNPYSNGVSATTKTTPMLRSVSAMPLDRIQAWQKSINSEPTSTAAGLTPVIGSALP